MSNERPPTNFPSPIYSPSAWDALDTAVSDNQFPLGITIGSPTTLNYNTEPTVGKVGYVVQSTTFNTTQISPTNKDILISTLPITAGVWMFSFQIQWSMTTQTGDFFGNVKYGPSEFVNVGIWQYISPSNFYFMSGSHIINTRTDFSVEILIKRNVDTYTINGPIGIVRAVRIA